MKIHEITIATKHDPHALLMAAARAGFVLEQVRVDGRPTDVGPYRAAGIRAQTPAGPAKASVPVPEGGEREVTGNRDPNPLAGVNFADNSAAGELAIEEGLTAADFEGREASGKTGFTKGDVRKIVREKDGE